MTPMEPPATKYRGFTLIETVIYIALFGILCSGFFLSIYPFFTSAERLSRNIATEGEVTFILTKIQYALNDTITSPLGTIGTPREGETADSLTLFYDGVSRYEFGVDTTNAFCTPPLTCMMLTQTNSMSTPLPLNSERVTITNFQVTHHAPSQNSQRYLEISFSANDVPVGPIRYDIHF